MTEKELEELEKIVAEAEGNNTLLEIKMSMKYLEEFKAKHPRPKHKKEGDKQ